MLNLNLKEKSCVVLDVRGVFTTLPIPLQVADDPELGRWLAKLNPETPWGDRKNAARKLGSMRDPAAVPGLLKVLPSDPFWMVRCAIIQALERIADHGAIPTLQQVAENDPFQVVRSYAAKAVERLAGMESG